MFKNSDGAILRTLAAVVMAGIAALALAGCDNKSGGATAKLKVGFITNGPANDWGYNYAHDLGRAELAKRLTDKVETTLIESVPETADAERVIERLIQSGTKMVVATSFGYQDTVHKLAAKHPDVSFLQAWGFKSQPNMGSYSAKMYEAWYVMGVVAGKTTKTNKLGVVAAHPIPPMKWQINAYVLGARSVNPNVTASIVFINHWFDATLASEATSTLIQQGADVVTGVLDNSVAVAQTAEKKGAFVIGHNADLSQFAPTRILTGTQWRWGGLYADATNVVLSKTPLDGRHFTGGLKEGFVGYTDYSALVPEETRKTAEEVAAKIRSGAMQVYAGPISDNKGELRVKAGESLTHDQIMAMDWLVEGVR